MDVIDVLRRSPFRKCPAPSCLRPAPACRPASSSLALPGPRGRLAESIGGRGDTTAWGSGRCAGYGATESARRPLVSVLQSGVALTSVQRFLRAGVSERCGARGPSAAEETELGQRLSERGGRRGGLAEPRGNLALRAEQFSGTLRLRLPWGPVRR
ncbi:hypothetical protein H8959_015736 [Pygathrix nigripes]